MGEATFPGGETGAVECTCARNVGNHRVSPADYACGRRSGARREHRWRAANVDGARIGENRRTRRNPRATTPLRNDAVFPRSLRASQSRRIAKRRRVAETELGGGPSDRIAAGNNECVAVALWATRADYEAFVMVTLRTAKRLQRIDSCYICNVSGCIRRNQSIRLCASCKILREQAWQCHTGNSKWPDDF